MIAHNKTLAAQLCDEFRELFPDNSVEYFVSYYDYYQPEAYIPSRTSTSRRTPRSTRRSSSCGTPPRVPLRPAGHDRGGDVSCIFGLGSPEGYDRLMLLLKKGELIDRDAMLRKLIDIQYTRNDTALARGKFRVRGEALEVFPAYAETAYRAVFFGDEIESSTTSTRSPASCSRR